MNYCTLFAGNYAARALALYRSMERWCGDFKLYALFMDGAAFQTFSRLRVPKVRPIQRREVDTPMLLEACRDRTLGETCWTYSPVVCEKAVILSGGESTTYVDADTLFFSDPGPAFLEIGDASIAIVPHRFPERLRATHERNGLYNVNFVHFKPDLRGLECLAAWRRDCTEWCYYKEGTVRGRRVLGDQLYWDEYASRFPVHAIRHPGVGLAPWNCENYAIGPGPTVDGLPVVQYHYHEFQRNGPRDYRLTNYPVSGAQKAHIYAPYLAAIERAHLDIEGTIDA